MPVLHFSSSSKSSFLVLYIKYFIVFQIVKIAVADRLVTYCKYCVLILETTVKLLCKRKENFKEN